MSPATRVGVLLGASALLAASALVAAGWGMLFFVLAGLTAPPRIRP